MQLTTHDQDRRYNNAKKVLAVRNQPQAPTPKQKDIQYEQACQFAQVFLIYSRIQERLGLRFQTVHLGLALFRKCFQTLQIPLGSLMVVCIYMAMKYQQIYPPSLKQVLDIASIRMDLSSYRKDERAVFLHLDGNLNVLTAAELLQTKLLEGEVGKGQRMMAFFLLELALISPNVISQYTNQQIMEAIGRLLGLGGQEREKENEKEVDELAKVLLQLRGKSNKAIQMVIGKYRHSRYMQIACMPIP